MFDNDFFYVVSRSTPIVAVLAYIIYSFMKKNENIKKIVFNYYVFLLFVTSTGCPFFISFLTRNEKILLFFHTFMPFISFIVLFLLFYSKNLKINILGISLTFLLMSTVLVVSSLSVFLLGLIVVNFFWY
ncbi:MAG: hypothetical protein AB7U85_04220 [Alphaproteobacteria bacterium]